MNAAKNALLIRVPGKPFAQARPRARGFVNKGRAVVTMYDPAANLANKARVHASVGKALEERMREWDATGPMRVTIDIRYRCMRPLKTAKREAEWRTKRPDIDNILKWLFDGMQPLIFLDDAQVVDLRVRKVEAHQDDPEATTVLVERIIDSEPDRRMM